MKILYSGFRDPKHTSAGGYVNITGMPEDVKILLGNDYPLGNHFIPHLARLPWTLLDIQTRIECHKYDIVHLIYGELTMFPLPYPKLKRTKRVITLHMKIEDKPGWFIRLLRSFDGIIVLSSQQKELLETRYGIKSEFIPHGFDKQSFQIKMPCSDKCEKLDVSKVNVAVVGNNYRDFSLLKDLVEFMDGQGKDVVFHIVGMPGSLKSEFRKYKYVRIYNRLDNDEYFSLLSACDYNFMPLTFATANNTLMEAQSVGLTSILPDIPGISDYGAPAPSNIFYSSKESLFNIFRSIEKCGLNTQLEEFAKKFSWSSIYVRLQDYYNKLLS